MPLPAHGRGGLTMRRVRICLGFLAGLAAALAAGLATAADLPLAAFFGTWQGSAVSESEISANFRLTSRDIGVTVKPAGGGFALEWTTVQRQRGTPGNPDAELKRTSLAFVPAERPGIWRAEGNADPIAAGQPYAWAHIDGRALVVKSLQILPSGRSELQVYRRSLTDLGMELEFVRMVDGEPARTARGRLVKVAN